MICSSVNRLALMSIPLPEVMDSTHLWRRFGGSGQLARQVVRKGLFAPHATDDDIIRLCPPSLYSTYSRSNWCKWCNWNTLHPCPTSQGGRQMVLGDANRLPASFQTLTPSESLPPFRAPVTV